MLYVDKETISYCKEVHARARMLYTIHARAYMYASVCMETAKSSGPGDREEEERVGRSARWKLP